MDKVFQITRYECKMQLKKLAGWLILIAAILVAMVDGFPSFGNLARLEFLREPGYFLRRSIDFPVLLLLFGLMFLQANRLVGDTKSGLKELFMAAPISRAQYMFGKMLGNFLFTLMIVTAHALLSFLLYIAFSPEQQDFGAYIGPLVTAFFCVILPACIFVTVCSVCLPAIIDMRLFYLCFSILFILNATAVGTSGRTLFFLITQGEASKFIWKHPRWPMIYFDAIVSNLLFLLGLSLLSALLIFLGRKLWRER